ncbi:MAG: NnrU family protein [Pseudomonadota bacterium]
MTILVIGLVLFLGVHSVSIFALPWRDAMVARNAVLFKAGYGVLSLVGLLMIIAGYGEARMAYPPLWPTPGFLRHLVALLMLPVFIFFLAPYFPGRIKTALKHPQLVAVKAWAFSHLLVNSALPDLLLFGSFLAWAVVDRISLKRRPVREPVLAAPASGMNDIILVVVGLAAYAGFAFWAHLAFIGVYPFG